MTVNNGQNGSIKLIARVYFLFVGLWLGIVAVLLYFNSADPVSLMLTFLAVLAFIISSAIFIAQKRVSIASLMALIIGFLLLAGGLMWGYGNTLSYPVRGALSQIAIGISMMAVGLELIIGAIAIPRLNKSAFPPNNINSTRMVMLMFIAGIFSIVVAIYLFVSGLQHL